jgi:hypothetical protein
MANTIPGGATQDTQGVWRDANGQALSKAAVSDATRLHDEIASQRADEAAAQALADAQRDPLYRALLMQQAHQVAAVKPEPKGEPKEPKP